MTRIAPDGKRDDREVIREAYGKIPKCQECEEAEATIWIRHVVVMYIKTNKAVMGDYFVCDACAFHLARILLQDIGHSFPKAVQT